jgi:O-antigen ligase
MLVVAYFLKMGFSSVMHKKLIKIILALQPLFTAPVYFSVLNGHPWLWLSLIIAIFPLGVRYWNTHSIITKTIFDIPILLFACGSAIGLIVAPNKGVAVGAVSSTFASILVYYGITANSSASKKYWLWTGTIISAITLILSLWFLSQGDHRVFPFNRWAFRLFSGLNKIQGPVMNLHTIGALLAVVIPPLFVIIFLKNSRKRIMVSLLCLFFTAVLFVSDSGSGWLAFIVSMTFILIIRRKKLTWVIIPAEGILAALALTFYEKMGWLMTTFSASSFMSRVTLWRNTLTLLKGKAAVLGLGPGAWLEVYSKHYLTTVAIVHNSYLQLYCDAGVWGLVAMVWAAIIFVHYSTKLLKSSRQNSEYWIGIGLIGSIIAGAVFSFFDTTYSITDVISKGYIYLVLPLLLIVVALISVVNDKLSKNEHKTQ